LEVVSQSSAALEHESAEKVTISVRAELDSRGENSERVVVTEVEDAEAGNNNYRQTEWESINAGQNFGWFLCPEVEFGAQEPNNTRRLFLKKRR
jgi:hypothetical protein